MKGLKVGDKRSFFVNSNEAYGPVNPQAFKEIPKSELPQGLDPKPGQVLKVTDSTGRDFPAVVAEVQQDKIKLNFNHPLAGKDLNFQITIIEIK